MKGNRIGLKRAYLFEVQGAVCHFCGKQCKFRGSGSNSDLFTVEHIVPLCWGGTDEMSNLVGACYFCNQERAREVERLPTYAERHVLKLKVIERRCINNARVLTAPFRPKAPQYFAMAWD